MTLPEKDYKLLTAAALPVVECWWNSLPAIAKQLNDGRACPFNVSSVATSVAVQSSFVLDGQDPASACSLALKVAIDVFDAETHGFDVEVRQRRRKRAAEVLKERLA